jgi:hypothetical protein
MDDYPDISCEPPAVATIGDEWICPKCARKFHYVNMKLMPQEQTVEAWFTNELR